MHTATVQLNVGVDPGRALQVLREVCTDLSNVPAMAAGANPGVALRDHFLISIENAELQMRNLWADDCTQWLHSERYWRIRELREDSPRPFPLVEYEVDRLVAVLDDLIEEVAARIAEDQAVDVTAARAVLDTNIYLHYQPFEQIDWTSVLAHKAVRIIVPIQVIRELDDQKNARRKTVAGRASARLAEMQRLLEGRGRGPVPVRRDVSLEVALPPRDHVEQQNSDEEILNRCEALARRRGGPVIVVTGDLSMRMRAEARGLAVALLGDELRLSGPEVGAVGNT